MRQDHSLGTDLIQSIMPDQVAGSDMGMGALYNAPCEGRYPKESIGRGRAELVSFLGDECLSFRTVTTFESRASHGVDDQSIDIKMRLIECFRLTYVWSWMDG